MGVAAETAAVGALILDNTLAKSWETCILLLCRFVGRRFVVPCPAVLFIYLSSMGKKLYVGGLYYGTTEDTLRAAFSQAGTVTTATIIMDRQMGRSKGFGFVEFATDEEAQRAIQMFNGQELEGRRLTVNEARPPEARPARQSGGYDRGGYGQGGY